MKVAILDDIHDAYQNASGVQRLRGRAEVQIFTQPFGSPEALTGFDALVANRERTRFTRDLLFALPDVRIIAQTGNHAYHIDMEAAHERGILIARADGGFSVGAAELTIGLMISLSRLLVPSDQAVKAEKWPAPLGRVLHNKTLGIIGFGHVGGYVAELARAFGMRVLAWGPTLTPQSASASGVTHRDLDDLIRESDFVSVHATLSEQSRGLLDARRLGLMKPTAYLVNTARGPIVDESALVDALSNKRIAGAGLDVFDREPLPIGHPLRHLENVVLTPHVGWPTDEAYERFADAAADVLLAYVDGQPVREFDNRH